MASSRRASPVCATTLETRLAELMDNAWQHHLRRVQGRTVDRDPTVTCRAARSAGVRPAAPLTAGRRCGVGPDPGQDKPCSWSRAAPGRRRGGDVRDQGSHAPGTSDPAAQDGRRGASGDRPDCPAHSCVDGSSSAGWPVPRSPIPERHHISATCSDRCSDTTGPRCHTTPNWSTWLPRPSRPEPRDRRHPPLSDVGQRR